MFIAINCCRLFVQNRSLPSARDTVVDELVRDFQQRKLLGNTESREVPRITTVSTSFSSSNGYYEAFTCVRKELPHQEVSLALVYFTSATIYKASLDDEFCIAPFALCTRLLFEEMQDFDSYRTELYSPDFAILEKVISAVLAADPTHRGYLVTQVLFPDFEKMMTTSESTPAAMGTVRRFKKDNQKDTQTVLRHIRSQFSTDVGGRSPESTSEPSPSASTASLPPSFSLQSKAPLRRSTRSRYRIPAPVGEAFSDEYKKT